MKTSKNKIRIDGSSWEDIFLQYTNSRISQKIKLLKLNENFNRDARLLRKKWKDLINLSHLINKKYSRQSFEYLKILNPSNPHFVTSKPDRQTKTGIKLGIELNEKLFSFDCFVSKNPIIKKKSVIEIKKEIEKIVKKCKRNRNRVDLEKQLTLLKLKGVEVKHYPPIIKDIIELSKKYRLFPIDLWIIALANFIYDNYFYLPSVRFDKKISKRPILSGNANFDIGFKKNHLTNEQELWIKIFDDTSFKDLKEHWKLISYYQRKIRISKGIKKRYYPLENLEIARKLTKLDKNYSSDWEKQEKIYGVSTGNNWGKIERKKKNRLKQIRYQYKKRLKF